MKKGNIKYVLKLRDKNKYIRKAYNNPLQACYRMPMLTPNKNLINKDFMFDDIKTAQNMIKYIISGIKTDYNKNYDVWSKDGFRSWGYHRIRDSKFYMNNGLEIVEFVPHFTCNINKKATHTWEKKGSINKCCSACGSNIPNGKYFTIKTVTLCPFCIRNLGFEAHKIIEEEKKINPNYEKDYKTTTFLSHL